MNINREDRWYLLPGCQSQLEGRCGKLSEQRQAPWCHQGTAKLMLSGFWGWGWGCSNLQGWWHVVLAGVEEV
jgi:hypothetical protein